MPRLPLQSSSQSLLSLPSSPIPVTTKERAFDQLAMSQDQETHRSSLWTSAKIIIRTLRNDDQRQKMEYLLYQRTMTEKELDIFHTFALYLREKQSIEAHAHKNLEYLLKKFVKTLT